MLEPVHHLFITRRREKKASELRLSADDAKTLAVEVNIPEEKLTT